MQNFVFVNKHKITLKFLELILNILTLASLIISFFCIKILSFVNYVIAYSNAKLELQQNNLLFITI